MFKLSYLGSIITVDRDSEINIVGGKVEVIHLNQSAPQPALKRWRTDKTASNEDEIMEARGEHFINAMPAGKRGPKADPNSANQRVWATILHFLRGKDEVEKREVIAAVTNAHPDLKASTINAYAMSCKGVRRNWGAWSLE